jgi:ubiquinone/menaquinone biosynthesis C-methylase UbiE
MSTSCLAWLMRLCITALSSDRNIERFDRRAQTYERGWRAEFHARVVTRSADVALQAVPDPTAVLDVGCGTGALLRTLADRLPTRVALAGVDPAPAMIEVGRRALGERSNAYLEVAFTDHVMGSGELIQTLMRHDLIDE